MQDERLRFLGLLKQPPARLTAEQTAWALNCQPHDVPVLVAARLLKPLGTPLPNSVKYFATVDVVELMNDRAWLAKATNAIGGHWREKNTHRRRSSADRAENGSAQIELIAYEDLKLSPPPPKASAQ